MAERYSRIYTLPGNLYSDNAPVIIAAGALLKDNQTGKLLAQLKIQNLDAHIVTGISLSFVLFNADGEPIGNPFVYHYNDISVEENCFFGQKEPVVLPMCDANSYQVNIQSVILSGNKVWEQEREWKQLPEDANIADIKQTLNAANQREEEEFAKELEELNRRVEEQMEAEKVAKQKRKKKTAIAIISVLLLAIALFSFLKPVKDDQTKADLLLELTKKPWQYHEYHKDTDWDDKFTITFVDEENMTYVSEPTHNGSTQKFEYECTWNFTSISSEQARIAVSRSDGKNYEYIIHFKYENGVLAVDKIVDSGPYGYVYYPK